MVQTLAIKDLSVELTTVSYQRLEDNIFNFLAVFVHHVEIYDAAHSQAVCGHAGEEAKNTPYSLDLGSTSFV